MEEKPSTQADGGTELRCQCGKILTDRDPCPIPDGKVCPELTRR
jgi:hypothetical protein